MSEKLKSQVDLFINKINDRTFSSSDFDSFLSAVRWVEGKNSLLFEISNFVAHQDKDRGEIHQLLMCHGVMSDFIKNNKLNETRNITADSFPVDVLQSIARIHNEKILKYYKKYNSNFFRIRAGEQNFKKAKKILENAFFRTPPIKPLISKSELISDFRGSVGYLFGSLNTSRLRRLTETDCNDVAVCLCSVLSGATIQVQNGSAVKPYFRSDDDRLRLVYNVTCEYPSCGVTLKNGAGITHDMIEIDCDSQEFGFFDGATVLVRDLENNLVFHK